ncbi:MAG: 23S rRNA (adenine(2503)-C(2))-methyltransferase RlmN [Alphaproteobacteria bacterium]|nr:23S rRNA (adenine(2503)-C(2))-methyltransferase RlmN [Alphaproteobacteria bacterium]
MNNKQVLFNLSPSELEQFIVGIGEPKFRAKQIAEWLWRGAPDFSVMKNLPVKLQEKLNEVAETLPLKIIKKLESSDEQTVKFLLQTTGTDAATIETVLMRTTYGNSVCVSSQVGCAMNCGFCASSLLGLKRNLTATEMLAQVLICNWTLYSVHDSRLTTHVVVMGTGEPLHNLDNLKEFLTAAHDKLSIGWRRMTVSTCGIVPGINELADWDKQVNLAISLHAPNDEIRDAIMPINKKYPIKDVMDAAFNYSAKSGRQLMVEYTLMQGIRDKGLGISNCLPEHAIELVNLLKPLIPNPLSLIPVMVNIIPLNAVAERGFSAPSNNAVYRFADILKENGIHCRIRRERGADIQSACGQLRISNQELGTS